MNKYCCKKFEVDVKNPSTTSPNIRIVKFLPNHILLKNISKIYGFYVTTGYEKFDILIPKMTISFCPYCGTKLHDFYNSDEFVNEIEKQTFNL